MDREVHGKFDMGYEACESKPSTDKRSWGSSPRTRRFRPSIRSVRPRPQRAGWQTIPRGGLHKPWDSLSDGEKRLFSHMAEVYAGFLSHADHQIGRLWPTWRRSEQLENTLIVLVSDNGASGEGGPDGSVNENKLFNGIPDDLEANLAMLDELGSPKTYNHYPTGWAMAFNTPFKMWKRYEFEGGIADPCIFSWPKGIKARGEVREQYHHAIDIVPTILDVLGVEAPESINGYNQRRIQGASMRYSFDDSEAPTAHPTQFYSMLGVSSHLPRRMEGDHYSSDDRLAGATSTTTGSCTTPTSIARSCTTSRTSFRKSFRK